MTKLTLTIRSTAGKKLLHSPGSHSQREKPERKMKGTSKVIMGATLVMVVSLAIVLALILVLVAELYCSLLLRRRQHKTNSNLIANLSNVAASAAEGTGASAVPSSQPQGPPLGTFLGVLRAPKSLLFPSCKEECNAVAESKRYKQCHHHHHHVLDIPNHESPSISLANSPQPNQKQDPIVQAGVADDQLVYISNPMFDNEANLASSSTTGAANTPFETPETSPSRLEMGGSSSSSREEDNDNEVVSAQAATTLSGSGPSSPTTPPLTPMKKLPKEACSVSLRDARSLGTSGSDTNSHNGESSSSSGSPCTSPSW